jgi:hypothetical protein
VMDPENIPSAAALLSEYGPVFESMEVQAAEALNKTRTLATELK